MCYEFYDQVQRAQNHFKEEVIGRLRNKPTHAPVIKLEPYIKLEQPKSEDEIQSPAFESHIIHEDKSFEASDDDVENSDEDEEVEENHAKSASDKNHSEEFSKYYNFKCSKCQLTLPTYLMFQSHMRKSHQNENPTVRCTCNMIIPCQRGKLLEHYLMHTSPEELQCRVCCKQLLSKRAKRQHEMTHGQKKKRGPPLPCPECDKMLADRGTLQSHMKNVHTPDDLRKKYVCDLCDRKLTTKFSILNHLIVKHNMEVENTLTNNEEILCPFCAKCFKNRSTYYYHHQVKHNVIMTVCPECGIEMNKKSLRSHMRRTHDRQTQNCPICLKQFKNMHAVLLHKNRVHVEPRHACDICGKMFKMKDKLKEHRKGHIIENRFQCDMCAVANNDYANILKHRKQVHPNATPIPHGMGKKMLEIGYQHIMSQ